MRDLLQRTYDDPALVDLLIAVFSAIEGFPDARALFAQVTVLGLQLHNIEAPAALRQLICDFLSIVDRDQAAPVLHRLGVALEIPFHQYRGPTPH